MVPGEVQAFHARVMSRLMADLSGLIQTHDLTPAQISTLFRLRRQSLTVTQVGSELGLTAPTASHLVDRLTARGLVERRLSSDDARRRDVSLTTAGQEFLAAFDAGLTGSLSRLLADVPEADLDRLATALRAVLTRLDSGPTPAAPGQQPPPPAPRRSAPP